MKLLIDGDLVAYRAAATSPDDDQIAIWRAGATLNQLRERWKTNDLEIYISGGNNFRYKLYPEYKANRRDTIRPPSLPAVQEALVTQYSAKVTNGYEADDALGIRNHEIQSNGAIICSLDKDLLQLPGRHYNWVKDLDTTVTTFSGLFTFYQQCLIGDTADNIPGVRGIGAVKSYRLLQGCTTEDELYNTTRHLFANDVQFHLVCKLIWVLREEGAIWQPPSMSMRLDEFEEEILPSSTPETPEEPIVFTAHT